MNKKEKKPKKTIGIRDYKFHAWIQDRCHKSETMEQAIKRLTGYTKKQEA